MLPVLQRIDNERPEWWALLFSAFAWFGMALHMVPLQVGPHAHHPAQFPSAMTQWLQWQAMIVAMMLPFLLWQIRRVAAGTFRYRRHLAVSCLIVGFLGVWAVAGLFAVMVSSIWSIGGPVAVGLLLVASAGWCLTPWYCRATYAHHSTRPLPPKGWHAVVRTVQEGARLGQACIVSCGPLMLACLASGHSVVVMLGGLVLTWRERTAFEPRPRGQARWHLVLAAVATVTLWTV